MSCKLSTVIDLPLTINATFARRAVEKKRKKTLAKFFDSSHPFRRIDW
jgi:hypothetical protein